MSLCQGEGKRQCEEIFGFKRGGSDREEAITSSTMNDEETLHLIVQCEEKKMHFHLFLVKDDSKKKSFAYISNS